MNNNMSPWLYQLVHKRQISALHDDAKTNIAIIGAGIAGVVTAYFILKNTDRKILLIEGGKVAHGATGHNAGQLIAEFERELHDIATEFGIPDTVAAEKALNSAWILIEQIFQEASLTTPYSTFTGYKGFQSIERLIDELKNNVIREQAGEKTYPVFIAEGAKGLKDIPISYRTLYSIIPHSDILNLLETDNRDFEAAVSIRKGCLNSALLCEELVGYMLAEFADRLMLVEHTPVKEIILNSHDANVVCEEHTVTADRVILCTNGFSKFTITNNAGNDINTQFHHQLHGNVGYMAGYIEGLSQQPTALAYYYDRSRKARHAASTKGDEYYDDPYFYLTRRPYEVEKNECHNLVCVGGPEQVLHDTTKYDPIGEFSDKATKQIDAFLKSTYRHTPKDKLEFKFKWHGLMGYTPNGIRLIGPEPLNPVLLYNLGCNGVGILPGIFGASRIARYIKGEDVEPMIFDPKRCEGGVC
jgi:glycine/D-amino acid oxidase-like deaminating enzyme